MFINEYKDSKKTAVKGPKWNWSYSKLISTKSLFTSHFGYKESATTIEFSKFFMCYKLTKCMSLKIVVVAHTNQAFLHACLWFCLWFLPSSFLFGVILISWKVENTYNCDIKWEQVEIFKPKNQETSTYKVMLKKTTKLHCTLVCFTNIILCLSISFFSMIITFSWNIYSVFFSMVSSTSESYVIFFII